jgi:hypothetical protein
MSLFMLGFAVNSFALQAEIPADTQTVTKKDPKITIGGEIRIRGWYVNNAGDVVISEDKTVQKEQTEKPSKQTHDTQTGK